VKSGCDRLGHARECVQRAALFALVCLGACGVEPSPLRLASPDKMQFVETVYPILLRDCGFPACHGAQDRFFRVYGPGRSRFAAAKDADPGDPATEDEISQSYERTRSMIDAKHPQQSLLLRKPLAAKAGGSGHKGTDAFDRNVYATVQEPSYQALRNWVFSLTAAQAAPGTSP
jgi:hypothetical protein